MTINQTTPLEIPLNGLVGCWDLNGDAKDTSGNGNDGTATDVTWVDAEKGYVSKVASFNGSSSKIDLGSGGASLLDINNNFTIDLIIKTSNDINSLQNIIGSAINTNNRISIHIENGYLYTAIYDGNIIYGQKSQLQSNTYYKITLINNNKTLSTYINGILENTNGDNISTDGNNTLYIGVRNDDSYYFNGNIGLVRIYNRVLTEQEIQALYLEGQRKLGLGNILNSQKQDDSFQTRSIPAGIPKPVLHITGKNDGTTYFDQSGNGHHGTQHGGVTTTSYGLYNKMSFDGSDDYIYGGDVTNINPLHHIGTNYFTIHFITEYIAKGTGGNAQGGYNLCFGANNNGNEDFIAFEYDFDNNRYHIWMYNSGNEYNTYYTVDNLGTITQTLVKKSGGKYYRYINGKLVSEFTWSNGDNWNSDRWNNHFVIGALWKDYGQEIADRMGVSNIYEVMIFDKALTPTQIQKLYYSRFVS